MKQVVDCLVVGDELVPRSWSKEVHRLDIACVHRDIPKDLTLSAEERRHPLTQHLVVFAIEVWRTRIPLLVCHSWILDWIESVKTHNQLRYQLKDRYGKTERGSEWEPIKILLEGDRSSNKMNTAFNTRFRLTTQVGQDHTATGVLLVRPVRGTGQTCERHRSDWCDLS
jgi:hypothetical protein